MALFITWAAVHAELLDRIVAIINGEVITLSELNEAKARLRLNLNAPGPLQPGSPGTAEPPAVVDSKVLNQLIERRLQLQVAAKRGITVPPEELDQFLREIRERNSLHSEDEFERALVREKLTPDQFKRDIEEQLKIIKLTNREIKAGILLDEKEVLRYYKTNKARFRRPGGIHLRQILLLVRDPEQEGAIWKKAREIVFKARSGADFESLGKTHSEGPGGARGRDLGVLEIRVLMPDIQRVVSGLKKGETSDPVRTPSGIQIFRVEDVLKGDTLPFEEVKDVVRNALFQERAVQRYQEWIRTIRKNAQVEIKY